VDDAEVPRPDANRDEIGTVRNLGLALGGGDTPTPLRTGSQLARPEPRVRPGDEEKRFDVALSKLANGLHKKGTVKR
jgi:hypothetical protein